MADPAAEVNALTWSIIAMTDATDRLAKVTAADPPRALAVVSEAVWWVTIVDSTLVRYHAEAYDLVLSGLSDMTHIEETLGGLRFVRNQIGHGVDHVSFIEPAAGPCTVPDTTGRDRVADWTWRQQPEPSYACMSAQSKQWELARYRAYRARLAGHTVGQTFGDAARFLTVATDRAVSTTGDLLSDQARAARPGR